jgi:hypothetical protein
MEYHKSSKIFLSFGKRNDIFPSGGRDVLQVDFVLGAGGPTGNGLETPTSKHRRTSASKCSPPRTMKMLIFMPTLLPVHHAASGSCRHCRPVENVELVQTYRYGGKAR